MSPLFGFGILVIIFSLFLSFASPGLAQTYQSFAWDSNGVSSIVISAAEVWEIITWGTETSSANGLDTLYVLPGNLTLSYTTNVFYTKLNKAVLRSPVEQSLWPCYNQKHSQWQGMRLCFGNSEIEHK